MSALTCSQRIVRVALGSLATISMCCGASAAEQFKWFTPGADWIPPTTPVGSAVTPPPSATVVDGDALSEPELKWSFINWVNLVASAKPQEAASIISSNLNVDSETAKQLISFGAEAVSRSRRSVTDSLPRFCDSLRAAKTARAFERAWDALTLQEERTRADLAGDLDSLFAGATAANIHAWIELNVRYSEKQGRSTSTKYSQSPKPGKRFWSEPAAHPRSDRTAPAILPPSYCHSLQPSRQGHGIVLATPCRTNLAPESAKHPGDAWERTAG
jgi:hypothetical protein